MLPSTIILLVALATPCLACDPNNMPDKVGFLDTMKSAPVVVFGTAIYLGDNPYGRHVRMQVECVYKSPHTIGKSLTINGEFFMNSCKTTKIKHNKKYLVALHDREPDWTTYKVYEPNVASTAAYLENDADFADMVKYCGFENVTAVAETARCALPPPDTLGQECLN